MDQIFLYLWLSLMAISLAVAPSIRRLQGRRRLTQEQVVSAAFASGSAIALLKVLIKVLFVQPEIQEGLEWDGTLGLRISSGLGMYLCFKEFRKLF